MLSLLFSGFSAIFGHSSPGTKPLINRSLIQHITKSVNSTLDEKSFAMDCDPFVEENYVELCGEIGLRQAFTPPSLTDHPDCNHAGANYEKYTLWFRILYLALEGGH